MKASVLGFDGISQGSQYACSSLEEHWHSRRPSYFKDEKEANSKVLQKLEISWTKLVLQRYKVHNTAIFKKPKGDRKLSLTST